MFDDARHAVDSANFFAIVDRHGENQRHRVARHQTGTQQRSSSYFQLAVDLIRNGRDLWTWDSRGNTLIPPTHKDIMGYCQPNWISSYTMTLLPLRRTWPKTLALLRALSTWG